VGRTGRVQSGGNGGGGGVIPPTPEPVAVNVKASNTALIVLDLVDPICTSEPRCMEKMLAPATSFLGLARSAGMFVLYGTRGPTLSKWLPDVRIASTTPTWIRS